MKSKKRNVQGHFLWEWNLLSEILYAELPLQLCCTHSSLLLRSVSANSKPVPSTSLRNLVTWYSNTLNLSSQNISYDNIKFYCSITHPHLFNQDKCKISWNTVSVCLMPNIQKKEYYSKSHYNDSSLLLQGRFPTKITPSTLMNVNMKKALTVGEKVLAAIEVVFHTPPCIFFVLLSSSHPVFHRILNSWCVSCHFRHV